jgi:pimeloyl-ACP methyl ester carboxylesterase
VTSTTLFHADATASWDVAEALAGRSSSQVVTAHGLAWSVLDAGAGADTLVLLPGTLGTVEVFYKQVLEFADRCRVVVLGYPGEHDAQAMTASFRALLDALHIDAAHFIGSSLGAYWLQVFLRDDAQRARSLLLGNTFVDPARLHFIRMFEPSFLASTESAALKEEWLAFVRALPQAELKNFMLEAVGRRQGAAELHGRSRTISLAARAAPIDMPAERITLLSCEDDKVVDANAWRELTETYPGARQVRLTHGGHYPHLLAFDLYNSEIDRRLAASRPVHRRG